MASQPKRAKTMSGVAGVAGGSGGSGPLVWGFLVLVLLSAAGVAALLPEAQSQATVVDLMALDAAAAGVRAATEQAGPEEAPAAPDPLDEIVRPVQPVLPPTLLETVDAAKPKPAPAAVAPRAKPPMTFNGRPVRPARTVRMVVTAYCPDRRCCGPQARGITASGKSVHTNGMRLVAADGRLLPFGSLVSVPGYHAGQPVPVLDRGEDIKGYRLDVLFPSHSTAQRWGRKAVNVTIWEYADRG